VAAHVAMLVRGAEADCQFHGGATTLGFAQLISMGHSTGWSNKNCTLFNTPC